MSAEILYHYCNLQAFMSIIKTKQLWLTDPRSMNDSTECWWYMTVLKDVLSELYKKENIDVARLNEIHQMAYANGSFRKFLTSFSEEENSLSQWRGYADDGRGFAIGFDVKKMNVEIRLPVPMAVFSAQHSLGLIPVEYNYDRQKELLLTAAKGYINKPNSPKEFMGLCLCAPILKNPGFAEEKEWRLVLNEPPQIGQIDKGLLKSDFRVVGAGISEYYIWPFCPDVISKIVLGPKNETSGGDVRNFLKANGYCDDIKIVMSTIPYKG